MSKSQPERKTTRTSDAARRRAARKTVKPRAVKSGRPKVPIDRTPVVPESRGAAAEPHDHAPVPASRAGVPADVVTAIQAAASKKAEHIVLLDLRRAAGFTDFFVIATGTNPRQIKAIAEAVEEALAKARIKPAHTEGYDRTEWVLLDYFDFVVHIFSAETRRFYGLERLWGSARTVDITGIVDAPAPALG
jgi:ribosome-associated protein